MAQQIRNNGETGLVARTKTNENFTELYADKLTSEQLTDLTDSGDSALHYHATDRARSNHTGTQTVSTISDFDTEVSNNSSVSANTTHKTSDGSDHTFIDQSVISGATPTLTGTNFTGIPNGGLTTNPLARANHTGTQLANTISDFDAQVKLNFNYNALSYLTGDGIVDDYSALYDLINTTIDGDDATIYFQVGTYKLGTSLSIPSNVNIKMEIGAMFSIDTGKELSINGGIEAGYYQIFDGVVVGKFNVPAV
ncbi:unnamed protein product [marine sediment metagenome]|uniref:Pectate lyase superfamily protein domain-containing protein n=1 Tax=marine sediment metagenome TaxID=412755 RepID=X0ZAN5_9ZZZZ